LGWFHQDYINGFWVGQSEEKDDPPEKGHGAGRLRIAVEN
jgi:hypothetical protein